MAEKKGSEILENFEKEEIRQRSRSVTVSVSSNNKTTTVGPPKPFEGRERAQSLFSDKEKYPPHWKLFPDNLRPHKSSSTSTLFIDSTISSPKNAELMKCLAEYIFKNFSSAKEETEKEAKTFNIFDETKHRLTSEKVDRNKVPELTKIEKFVKDVFQIGQLAPESLIMSVAYINRIQKKEDFKFYPHNWRRMLLASLMLASKVWEDQAVWLVDFIDLFPLATPRDLNLLEKKILALLNFDVSLKASEYSKIYFDIRAQSDSTTEHFKELKPLDKEGIERLEIRSKNFVTEKNVDKKNLPRTTGSYDNLKDLLKSPRAVLS